MSVSQRGLRKLKNKNYIIVLFEWRISPGSAQKLRLGTHLREIEYNTPLSPTRNSESKRAMFLSPAPLDLHWHLYAYTRQLFSSVGVGFRGCNEIHSNFELMRRRGFAVLLIQVSVLETWEWSTIFDSARAILTIGISTVTVMQWVNPTEQVPSFLLHALPQGDSGSAQYFFFEWHDRHSSVHWQLVLTLSKCADIVYSSYPPSSPTANFPANVWRINKSWFKTLSTLREDKTPIAYVNAPLPESASHDGLVVWSVLRKLLPCSVNADVYLRVEVQAL